MVIHTLPLLETSILLNCKYESVLLSVKFILPFYNSILTIQLGECIPERSVHTLKKHLPLIMPLVTFYLQFLHYQHPNSQPFLATPTLKLNNSSIIIINLFVLINLYVNGDDDGDVCAFFLSTIKERQ